MESQPMSNTSIKPPNTRVRKVTFPWLSAISGLALIVYLLLRTEPDLARFYPIPEVWFLPALLPVLMSGFLLLLLRDLFHHYRQHRNQARDIQRLHNQVAELWQSKKQLQLKAHTYSGHADKLKLFISDKLLDYIEYDEKFLHFKSIARKSTRLNSSHVAISYAV